MRIAIINGPNLNLLGIREPSIYGSLGLEDLAQLLREQYPAIEWSFFQSNIEGEIIDELHRVGANFDGIVLNAAGYTHTSVSIGDAIAGIQASVIEVHITNVHAREEYRHSSLLAAHCQGVITGFGLDSYRLAVQALVG